MGKRTSGLAWGVIVMALLMTGGQVHGDLITITFEAFPGPDGVLGTLDDVPIRAPSLFADQTQQLTNQFASLGIQFIPIPSVNDQNEILNSSSFATPPSHTPPTARGVQHGPGGAVHGGGVHRAAGVGRGGGAPGWARAVPGQRVCGAAVAERAIGGRGPVGLRSGAGSGAGVGETLRLQPRAAAPGAGIPHARSRLWRTHQRMSISV